MRCVCKAWNEILRTQSFHNLHDLNRKREAYVFLTRYVTYFFGDDRHPEQRIDPLFMRQTMFLDVNARRWYSIRAHDGSYGDEFKIVAVFMNDGLVCELARFPGDEEKYALFIVDPIANIKRELPTLPNLSWVDVMFPITVLSLVSVDNASHTFLVYTKFAETKMYLYESSSSKWRALASPSKEERLGQAVSALPLHDILYVVFNAFDLNNMCSLLSYNLQENMWRVCEVNISRSKEECPDPHIFVDDNELWMTRWYRSDEFYWRLDSNMYFELESIRTIDKSSMEFNLRHEMFYETIVGELGEYDDSIHDPFPYSFSCTQVNLDDKWDRIIWLSDLSG